MKETMKQPTQREQHLQTDADSLRSIIAKERNRAQVVLSQKGVLEVINAKLLEALEEGQRIVAIFNAFLSENMPYEELVGVLDSLLDSFGAIADDAIEEARK